MMKLCFATNNKKKIDEMTLLLPSDIEMLSMAEIGCEVDIVEDGATLETNALIKARYISTAYGVASFGDDTGLMVDALDGEPGVYSARYAGVHGDSEANMTLLLQNLTGKTNRKAYFATVIAAVIEGKEYVFRGEVHGTILDHRRGTAGFGYDPIFVPDGYDTTFAEMSIADKNKISHRALAVQRFISFLQSNNYAQ